MGSVFSNFDWNEERRINKKNRLCSFRRCFFCFSFFPNLANTSMPISLPHNYSYIYIHQKTTFIFSNSSFFFFGFYLIHTKTNHYPTLNTHTKQSNSSLGFFIYGDSAQSTALSLAQKGHFVSFQVAHLSFLLKFAILLLLLLFLVFLVTDLCCWSRSTRSRSSLFVILLVGLIE